MITIWTLNLYIKVKVKNRFTSPSWKYFIWCHINKEAQRAVGKSKIFNISATNDIPFLLFSRFSIWSCCCCHWCEWLAIFGTDSIRFFCLSYLPSSTQTSIMTIIRFQESKNRQSQCHSQLCSSNAEQKYHRSGLPWVSIRLLGSLEVLFLTFVLLKSRLGSKRSVFDPWHRVRYPSLQSLSEHCLQYSSPSQCLIQSLW